MKTMFVNSINDIPRSINFWQPCTYMKLQDISLQQEEGKVFVYGLYPKYLLGKPYTVGRELVGCAMIGQPIIQQGTTVVI